MKSIAVPAASNGNPGVYSESNSDTVFICISSDGACKVQIGSQAAVSCIAGLVLGEPGAAPLGSIVFQNFGSTAVNVTFDTGKTAQKGATPTAPADNFFNLPIFGNAGSLTGTRSLPTGSGATIPGTQTINGVVKTRQYIEITNFDATNILYVFTDHLNLSTLDQCIGGVFPNSFRRFEVSKNLVLVNIAASAIQCTAYEQY